MRQYKQPTKSDFTDLIKQIENDYAHAVVDYMLKHIEADMRSTLRPVDFVPEADQYMLDNDMPYDPAKRDTIAAEIYDTFFDMLPTSIQLDDSTLAISINPVVWALEYGDFYKPSLRYVSTTIKKALDDAMKSVKNI